MNCANNKSDQYWSLILPRKQIIWKFMEQQHSKLLFLFVSGRCEGASRFCTPKQCSAEVTFMRIYEPKNESQEKILIFQRNQYTLSVNKWYIHHLLNIYIFKSVGWTCAYRYMAFKCSAWSYNVAIWKQ